MTDQRPDGTSGPGARRGAARAGRRLVRAGTIMAVMALGAGGGVAAAAGASDLLAPAGAPGTPGTLDYSNRSVSSTELHLPQVNDAVKTTGGQLGRMQALVGPQTVATRDMHDSAAANAAAANPAGDLTGTVTDLGGKPLPDITLYEVTQRALRLLGHTGGDGTFRTPCPAGPVLMSSTGLTNAPGAPGAAPTGPTGSLGALAYQFLGGGSTLSKAPIPLCGSGHTYRAEMAPAGEIDGVLRDASGRPAAGVPLTLVGTGDPEGMSLQTVTDRHGRFLFGGLPAGRYRKLAGSTQLGGLTDVLGGLPVLGPLLGGLTGSTGGSTGGDAAEPSEATEPASPAGAPASDPAQQSQGRDGGLPVGNVGYVSGPTGLLGGLASGLLPAAGGLSTGTLSTGPLSTSSLGGGLISH